MAATMHTADLFLKVSSFTRYLLNDVLPAEVYNEQGFQISDLVEECDALIASLRAFKELTKVFPKNDVHTSSQINNGNISSTSNSVQHDCSKFRELCEALRKKVVTLSDLITFKPYFCTICNVATWYKHVFNQHCVSKKHVKQTNETPEPLKMYKCKICQLLLMGPQSEINCVTTLPEHFLLDEHVLKLKESADKLQSKDSDHQKSATIGSSEDVLEVKKTDESYTAEFYCVPPKVNQLFQIMKKRLKSDTNLSEIVPHYCSVCDVMAYSVSKFIEHSSSKEHISAVNSATTPINVLKCEKCGFLITGYQISIDGLISSAGHRNLDEYVRTLTDSKVGRKSVGESASPLNGFESFNSNTETVNAKSKQNLIPQDLKTAINALIEKLKLPSDLKKYAPSFCHICVKVFISSNDFEQHLASRKHNLIASPVASSLCVRSCPKCSISFCGTDADISNALDLLEHINLHKKIDYLFLCNQVPSNTDKNSTDIPNNKPSLDRNVSNNTLPLNISESRKSLLPNEMQACPNQPHITSFLFNKQNFATDLKGNLAPTKRIDKGIPDKFLTINSKLQCGNFSKAGFCRPCKKGINLIKGWGPHLSCSRHKKTMEKTPFENIPLPCNYCPLQILGDQVFGNVCMDIHLKLNHPHEKPINIKSEIIPLTLKNEGVELLSDVYSGSSSVQSKSPERTDCDEISSNGRNSSTIRDLKEEINLTTEKNTTKRELHIAKKDFHNKQHSSEHCSETCTVTFKCVEDCVRVFTRFLEKRRAVFLNEGLKQFGGMCLFCAHTFEDYYDWLIHLTDPCVSNVGLSDVIEKECANCNLSLYGSKAIIDSDFWSLKEHTSLDILLTQ